MKNGLRTSETLHDDGQTQWHQRCEIDGRREVLSGSLGYGRKCFLTFSTFPSRYLAPSTVTAETKSLLASETSGGVNSMSVCPERNSLEIR